MKDAIAHKVSLTDDIGNTLTEDAAADLIENGELRRHARKVRQVYAKRRCPRGLRIGFASLNEHEAHTAIGALRSSG